MLKIASIAFAVIASAAILGGCSKSDVSIAAVVEGAQNVCKFVPSVESVVAVLSADPTIATAEAAIGVICSGFNAWAVNQPATTLSAKAASKEDIIFNTLVNGKTISVTGKKS